MFQAMAGGDEKIIAAAKSKMAYAQASLDKERLEADMASKCASEQHVALWNAQAESNAEHMEAELVLEDLCAESDFQVDEFHTRTAAQSMAEKAAAKLKKSRRSSASIDRRDTKEAAEAKAVERKKTCTIATMLLAKAAEALQAKTQKV